MTVSLRDVAVETVLIPAEVRAALEGAAKALAKG
jgi:hypothetical protein